MVNFTTFIFSLANLVGTLGSGMFAHSIFGLVFEIQKIIVRLAVRPLNKFRYL